MWGCSTRWATSTSPRWCSGTCWAAIMGVGYYKNLVQWSQGEYATANNTEDDFAVMAANGGPRRADDHGDTPATATALTVTASGGQSLLSGQGVIERRKDLDAFSFAAGAGPGYSDYGSLGQYAVSGTVPAR